MKLWAGRFQKETDTLVNDFNASINFDARLYRQDITGSIAHATMLGEQGIIPQEDAQAIINGLKAILSDIEGGGVEFSLENEDIHMNIETILTQRIGEAGKRLHTGRSRNDQVAVDFRLYIKEEIPKIIKLLLDLEDVLIAKAQANLDVVMPGYTHLQRAQPTTFAHYMMAYANMIRRDVTRFEDCLERMDECPLGAGALATSSYPVNRQRTAELLGGHRLVTDDEPGPQGQGLGDGDALALAPGELVGIAVLGALGHPHQIQQPVHLLLHGLAGGQAVVDHGVRQNLKHVFFGVQGGVTVLKHHLQLGAHPFQGPGFGVGALQPVKADGAGGGFFQPDDLPADGALAAAGLSHQAQGGAGVDGKAHVVHRVDVAGDVGDDAPLDRVINFQMLHLEQRLCLTHARTSWARQQHTRCSGAISTASWGWPQASVA